MFGDWELRDSMHACLRGVDHPNPQASQFSVLFCLCWGEKKHMHRGSNLHHHFSSLFHLLSLFSLPPLTFFPLPLPLLFLLFIIPPHFLFFPFSLSPSLHNSLFLAHLGPQSFKETRVSLTKTPHLNSATDCTAGTRKVTRLLP